MERVTGIGGVFFKARDPAALAAWNRQHLGIESNGRFAWVTDPEGNRIELWEPPASDPTER